MNKIIFTLITIGLLWNSLNFSVNTFDFDSKKTLGLSFELSEEKLADSQEDDERESYELDYLALNNISKQLLASKISLKNFDSFILLGFISPVFTPPPNLS
jgi:hypothetical protein